MESLKNRVNLAELYFRKAHADLESAKQLLASGHFANAVFLAQQCGEKAAKAALALKNMEIREHVVSGYLASEIIAFAPESWEEKLRDVVRMLVALEEHSIKPRYPFVTAAKIWDPEKGYDRPAAETAVQKAESILMLLQEYSKSDLGYKSGKSADSLP